VALNREIKETNNPQEIRINCPFCAQRGKGEDTGFHLYIHTEKHIFNCFRCGAGGKSKELGYEENSFVDISTPTIDSLSSKISKLCKIKKSKEINLDAMGWKIDSYKTPIAYEYMHSRGFSDEDLVKYNIYVGRRFINDKNEIDKRWEGRVIFPFTEDNEVKLLIGRTYINHDTKYINSEGNKSNFVYGLDSIIGDECIICEGIISAIAATRYSGGVPAVAILGKAISDVQASKIRSKCSKVIMSLDGDVILQERQKMAKILFSYGFNSIQDIVLPYKKDPDDLKEEYLKYFNGREGISLKYLTRFSF
jgi:hypothetical protein